MVGTVVPGSTVNKGVKGLSIRRIGIIDEKLSTAMRLGLGMNSTVSF
jgi:hypothetical protein